jgi:hypothetical protein
LLGDGELRIENYELRIEEGKINAEGAENAKDAEKKKKGLWKAGNLERMTGVEIDGVEDWGYRWAVMVPGVLPGAFWHQGEGEKDGQVLQQPGGSEGI